MRDWPECRKNKRADDRATPKILAYGGGAARVGGPQRTNPTRTRAKKALARLEPRPVEEVTPVLPFVPFSYFGPCRIQEVLAICVNTYIRGFFDAATTTNEVLETQYRTEWQWRTLYNRCQAVSLVVQKSTAAIQQTPSATAKMTPGWRKAEAQRRQQRVDNVIRGIIHRRVLAEFAHATCSPHMLVNFWNLCRTLRGIAARIQGNNETNHVYIIDCARALRDVFGPRTHDHHAGLMKILEYLVQVPPGQVKDTLELLSKCTAEILSTRLDATHPLILQAYSDYYRYWNEAALSPERRRTLLEEYQQSLEKSEERFGKDDDRTIQILSSYAAAAYYIWRDNDLAKRLATELWQQTNQRSSATPSTPTTTTTTRENEFTSASPGVNWTAKAQCMADAATILGLVCATHHEYKRKTKKEMRDHKKSMGCDPRKKKGRDKWRQISTAVEPPIPWKVGEVAAKLRQAVETLQEYWVYAGAWDGLITVASLSDQLRGLERGARPRVNAADSKYGEAETGQVSGMTVGGARQSFRNKKKKGSYHDEKSPLVIFASQEVSCLDLLDVY